MITDKQRAFIASLFDSREVSADVHQFTVHSMGGKKLALYSKSEASKLIGLLLACKPLAKASKPVSKPSGIDLTPVPAGRYAVPGEDGKLRFVIIDKPEDGKWKGYAFVKIQASDDRYPLGRQYPNSNSYVGKSPELVKAIAANPSEASKRYGHKIGKCGVCGRTLTDEVSRANGIGPICAEKHGW